jgi:putative DNA methylase
VATPKHQAREPIDIDVILVCRKVLTSQTETNMTLRSIIEHASVEAEAQVLRLRGVEQSLSRNDIQVIFMAQVAALLSRNSEEPAILALFDKIELEVGAIVGRIHTK